MNHLIDQDHEDDYLLGSPVTLKDIQQVIDVLKQSRVPSDFVSAAVEIVDCAWCGGRDDFFIGKRIYTGRYYHWIFYYSESIEESVELACQHARTKLYDMIDAKVQAALLK